MLDVSFLKTNILFNQANVNVKKVLASLEDDNIKDDETPHKRRRLDDFTCQEKMVRRKLKNRVAAQTARDRKKERMTQLEEIVERLEVENKELKRSNEELRTNMDYLMDQNKELRTRLNMDVTPDTSGDHTYSSKKRKLSESIVTEDSKHTVVKIEEGSVSEHAAEITDTSCFINHDVVSQSQIDQIFDLLGQIPTEQIPEVNSVSKFGNSTEAKITERIPSTEVVTSVGSSSNLSVLSEEETDELLSLCDVIRELVGKPDNVASTHNKTVINSFTEDLIKDIPDEVLSHSPITEENFDEEILNASTNTEDFFSSPFTEENFEELLNASIKREDLFNMDVDTLMSSYSEGMEESSAFYDDFSENTLGNTITDLFPSLA